MEFGGANRDRTDDLLVANEALSQLSYSPFSGGNHFPQFTSAQAFRKACGAHAAVNARVAN